MKHLMTAAAALCLLAGSVGIASAQGHDDHADNHAPNDHAADNHGPDNHGAMAMKGPAANAHADWHAGGHIEKNDWNRGQKVDYRSHHLRTPPSGYEWRQVDNNYVLAAVATGVIASVILASH